MKFIFSFIRRKIKLLLKILALVIIAGLWLLSIKYAAPTGSFSIFFINGEVIPMTADEHIVARIADKNCKITHVRTKQFSKRRNTKGRRKRTGSTENTKEKGKKE